MGEAYEGGGGAGLSGTTIPTLSSRRVIFEIAPAARVLSPAPGTLHEFECVSAARALSCGVTSSDGFVQLCSNGCEMSSGRKLTALRMLEEFAAVAFWVTVARTLPSTVTSGGGGGDDGRSTTFELFLSLYLKKLQEMKCHNT